jgi:hypothetical protein
MQRCPQPQPSAKNTFPIMNYSNSSDFELCSTPLDAEKSSRWPWLYQFRRVSNFRVNYLLTFRTSLKTIGTPAIVPFSLEQTVLLLPEGGREFVTVRLAISINSLTKMLWCCCLSAPGRWRERKMREGGNRQGSVVLGVQ